ncbi:MAG: prepilin-type N-terminal cleavage/methylation domain-containing protein [Candidatus Rifleibacteriota bacterium]
MGQHQLKKKGITLVEIMMALVILALAALPVIGTFSKYYGVASRQMDQEIALKIAEATMNKLMAYNYSDMISGGTFSVPVTFDTPTGGFSGNLNFNSGVTSSTSVTVGKITCNISAQIEKIFVAQNLGGIHTNALEFEYGVEPPPPSSPGPPPPPVGIASYSSFDDHIVIKLRVDYGSGQKDFVELAAFRADMTR